MPIFLIFQSQQTFINHNILGLGFQSRYCLIIYYYFMRRIDP